MRRFGDLKRLVRPCPCGLLVIPDRRSRYRCPCGIELMRVPKEIAA